MDSSSTASKPIRPPSTIQPPRAQRTALSGLQCPPSSAAHRRCSQARQPTAGRGYGAACLPRCRAAPHSCPRPRCAWLEPPSDRPWVRTEPARGRGRPRPARTAAGRAPAAPVGGRPGGAAAAGRRAAPAAPAPCAPSGRTAAGARKPAFRLRGRAPGQPARGGTGGGSGRRTHPRPMRPDQAEPTAPAARPGRLAPARGGRRSAPPKPPEQPSQAAGARFSGPGVQHRSRLGGWVASLARARRGATGEVICVR